MRHGLVDGTVLYTDSTHLKANANKGKYDLEVIAKSRADYWDDLDAAIDEDRAALSGRNDLDRMKTEDADIRIRAVTNLAF